MLDSYIFAPLTCTSPSPKLGLLTKLISLGLPWSRMNKNYFPQEQIYYTWIYQIDIRNFVTEWRVEFYPIILLVRVKIFTR